MRCHGEQSATTGYFFDCAGQGGQWVKDIWEGDLARALWPADFKKGLLAYRARKRLGKPDPTEAARLDSATFGDFATRELGVSAQTLSYITQGMCIPGPQISAYGAQSYPGIDRYAPGSPAAEFADRFISFPGGNSTIARHFVKILVPDAFSGSTFDAIASGPIDRAALDRAGAPCRIRLNATAVRVEHEGDPQAADHVTIVYERGGRLYRVRAKATVLAVGAWVGKHIVADLPAVRRDALDQFLYAPVLIANVALRNWRFLDKLGFSSMRWFDGFDFFASIRRPMVLGDRGPPFHPDKPIVMTIYAPFPNPALPLEAQGPTGRAQMFATTLMRTMNGRSSGRCSASFRWADSRQTGILPQSFSTAGDTRLSPRRPVFSSAGMAALRRSR